MGKKNALTIVEETGWTTEQDQSLRNLHVAMGGFFTAVFACHQAGIPLADAFEAIGIEIPRVMQPMLNALAEKMPTPES